MKQKIYSCGLLLSNVILLLAGAGDAHAQNDVMMQAFYWDVPVDAGGLNGTWYDSLKAKANSLKNAGFTAV
jgi:alpha-amylase